jgi:TetR/AcrR family transcriptional regulator, repressor of fatR-cypB operon
MPKPVDKEAAILEAALALFVERGFHGTAVPAVAERAGVSAGTIYHYFDSKESLVNTLYRKWKAAIAEKVFVGFPVDRPPREQFQTVWRRMAEFALAHPREFAFLELHHHASYLDAESIAVERQLLDFGTAMISKAQGEQALKQGDPQLLMAVSNGAFIGLFRAGLEKALTVTMKEYLIAEQLCWEAVRA